MNRAARFSDGSYVFIATVNNGASGSVKQLVKVNSEGELCWSIQPFKTSAWFDFVGEGVDKEILIVADTSSVENIADIIVRYDSDGNLISMNPIFKYKGWNYRIENVAVDKGNSLLSWDLDSIYRFGFSGDLISKNYAGEFIDNNGVLQSFRYGYLATKGEQQPDSSWPLKLSWLNADLKPQKSKLIPGTHAMVAWKCIPVPGKGIALLCGNFSANRVGYLIFMDEAGNEQWRAPMPYVHFLKNGFQSLAIDKDSGLIACGNVGWGLDSLSFVHYTINGEFQGERSFSFIDTTFDCTTCKDISLHFFDIDPTDQRITILGNQAGRYPRTPSEITFLKFDNPWIEYKRPQMRLVIYPNPVHNEATVILPPESCCSKSSDIVVYDAQGREVFRDRNARNAEYQLRLPVLKQGIYLCRLLLDGKPFGSEKIFVQ